MLPNLLDISNEKCRGTLRRLELEAYSNVISVFRAQGNLSEEKTKILDELRNEFKIGSDRHRSEVRRANSDELLITISEKLFGKGSQIEWLKEGRRAFPLLSRSYPLTALSHIAAQVSRQAYRENVKLAREEAIHKVKVAAIERASAERASAERASAERAATERASAELEISNVTSTIISDKQNKLNEIEVKIDQPIQIENGLGTIKNEDIKLSEEDMSKVNYLELKELLKLSTTIKNKKSLKSIKNHITDKRTSNIKRKLKKKKEKILNNNKKHKDNINHKDKDKDKSKDKLIKSNNIVKVSIENKQAKIHKKRKRKITEKEKKLNDINDKKTDEIKNNTVTSKIITNIPPINYDNYNQMPVQKCILNIDLKSPKILTSTSPSLPSKTLTNELHHNNSNRKIDLKRLSLQPIETILEPKRINITDATKILKIDNFNSTQTILSNPIINQSQSNIICLNQLNKLDNQLDTSNRNPIPVNIHKLNPIIMNNIKLNSTTIKPSSIIKQRKLVNLMTSSNGKVFIRPVDEKISSTILSPIIPTTTGTSSLSIQPSTLITSNQLTTTTATLTTSKNNLNPSLTKKINLPTLNLTNLSILDNNIFNTKKNNSSLPIKTKTNSIDLYSNQINNSLTNKNYQIIQVQSNLNNNIHNNNLEKQILNQNNNTSCSSSSNSNSNIFVIGTIQTDLKDNLKSVDIKNKAILKIDNINKINNNHNNNNNNNNNNLDLITEDTPVDIINENVLQYNDSIIVDDDVNNINNNNEIKNSIINNNILINSNSNNNRNLKNINQDNFYKNYGESSVNSIILETKENSYKNYVDNIVTIKSPDTISITPDTIMPMETTLINNEVDWELELDQQAQKTNNDLLNNSNSCFLNNYTNNCIIYKNINNEKTSNSFNDYIEEIVEESISDDESDRINEINNGYFNFQEEEECIDVDDSTINAIKN